MIYEGIELPVQATLRYFVAHGADKVAEVAARHDASIPLPAWQTYSIQDPRGSIGNWPALLVDGIQSLVDPAPNAPRGSRIYRIGVYVIAKATGEEAAKTCAQRYVVAAMELLREMNAATAENDGVRWRFVPPPDEYYVRTFIPAGSQGYLSDARIIASCYSPHGDGWVC